MVLFFVSLCLLGGPVISQERPASVTVRVTDPDGAVFTQAFVWLTHAEDGEGSGAESAGDGAYTFAPVTAGTYDLSVNVPGMKPFSRTGLVVEPGATLRLEARLEDTLSLRTLGEDPETIAALFINRPPPPEGPTPRMAKGTPDLSGMWLSGPAQPGELDMLPWARELMAQRQASDVKDHPSGFCLPGPVPLMGAGWFKLAQTPDVLIMLFEMDPAGYRQIFLDGRDHPPAVGPTWMGHAVGTWEGDTLVIESIGFRHEGWFDFEGRPHSDRLRVTQRIRRPDLGNLEIAITIDDPGAYGAPWTVEKGATLAPDEEILEYVCNENNKAPGLMSGAR